MAYESVAITAGAGTDIAVDTVAAKQIQVVKLDAGGDGVSVPVVAGQQTMAASVPVVLASDQTAVPVSDGGGIITVDGTVAVTNADITTIAGAVAGTEMQVDVLTSVLPTGAATSALQGGGLPATLGAGGGLKVDGSGTALPVSVATVPSHAVTNAGTFAVQVDGDALTALQLIDNCISGSEAQVDVVGALPAGDNLIGHAPPDTVTVDVTLSMTAEAHHAGDVLAATQEVTSVARANGKGVELVSMVVRDADDQTAAATTFYFLDANSALGTEGSAPDIDDTEVQDICGLVVVPAAAWIDLGTSKVAVMPNIGLLMHPAAGSTSLWIAATTAGTPTPSASGMTVTLQFVRY